MSCVFFLHPRILFSLSKLDYNVTGNLTAHPQRKDKFFIDRVFNFMKNFNYTDHYQIDQAFVKIYNLYTEKIRFLDAKNYFLSQDMFSYFKKIFSRCKKTISCFKSTFSCLNNFLLASSHLFLAARKLFLVS